MNTWLVIGALTSALGWLLPNHQLPWTSFHNDAWVAAVLLAFSWVSLFYIKNPQPWHRAALFAAALSLVPLIQFSLGHVKLAGTAWIGSLYLMGFCLAILTGSRWGSVRPDELPDALFLAIACAATVSVAIQLCQWLNMSDGCLCSGNWVQFAEENYRASANLGQPNQLATLLVWGVLAYGWAWMRKAVSAAPAIAGIIFLLFGLALTGSRTGALALCLMTLCVWHWRRFWSSPGTPKTVAILFFCYLVMVWLLPSLSHALLLDYPSSLLSRTKDETRFDIWAMFLGAIWQQPWFGYGWDQTLFAQASASTVLPVALVARGTSYAHAHNLFVDLVLWMGIPLGFTVVAAILFWVRRAVLYVKNSGDALLVMSVLAVGLHAMLELPLHYAYFLLPLGLVAGVIGGRLHTLPVFVTGIKSTAVIWFLVTLMFIFVVRDYFLAEESYNELRLEKSRVLSKVPRSPPDVVLLTQLREVIIFARFEPTPQITAEQTVWLKSVALTYPTSQNLLKLATALALTGQIPEALDWLGRICEMSSKDQCGLEKVSWQRLQLKFPQLETVAWPDAISK